MKHSEILQLALDKYLAETESDSPLCGKSLYICGALSIAVAGQSEEIIATKEEIKIHIQKCLHPYYSVTLWLINNKDINISRDSLDPEQIQLYRKRWVLHLIEEYKKQGK